MKKSTILGIGLLSVVGVGAYIYLKGKKSTTPISISPTSTNTTTNTTSGTSSTVDSSLGLSTTTQSPAKATIDNVVSAFAETQTENYKKAKVLSKDIEVFMVELKDLQKIYDGHHYSYSSRSFASFDVKNKKKQISDKTAQANALGYKILPYGEIEKM